jgi:hypothetical protein
MLEECDGTESLTCHVQFLVRRLLLGMFATTYKSERVLLRVSCTLFVHKLTRNDISKEVRCRASPDI